jgi:hypothetical protein
MRFYELARWSYNHVSMVIPPLIFVTNMPPQALI